MIKCEVLIPGKLVIWKNGSFRTPLSVVVKNEKEVKEFKMAMKSHGISEKAIKTEKFARKPKAKTKAKVEAKAKPEVKPEAKAKAEPKAKPETKAKDKAEK